MLRRALAARWMIASLPLCALVLLAVSPAAAAHAPAPIYDVILSGGRIVDGTGAPWRLGDLAISGDRIAAMGDLRHARTRRRLDVRGLVVAPGFIDMLGQSEYWLLVDGR